MSIILEKAKKIANNNLIKLKAEAELLEKLNDELKNMKRVLFDELKKIHNQDNKYGNFFADFTDHTENNVICLLWLANDLKNHSKEIAWFKGAIIQHDDYDYNNPPRLKTAIRARFYSPDHNQGWDFRDNKFVNSSRTIYASSINDMPRFFDEMAEELAKWM